MPAALFCAAPLANVEQVISDQAKIALCGEWFGRIASPVWIEVANEPSEGKSLESLGRCLRWLEIAAEEVIVQLGIARDPTRSARECWERSCRLLGDPYRPRLVSLDWGADTLKASTELKASGVAEFIGIEARGETELQQLFASDVSFDFVVLSSGCSIMRLSPRICALMRELAARQTPVVVGGVFDGGFLVGGNRLDGRVLNADDVQDRSRLAWRKSFVALCDGYGISPAHACIQFARALPGVVAIRLTSSRASRVAENVQSLRQEVPRNFWAALVEEGLLPSDLPVSLGR